MQVKSKSELVYIASDVRSGSTLLDLMLGSHSEVSSVGEIQFLMDHFSRTGMGRTWEWKCTCGMDFDRCEFWSEINRLVYEKTGDNICDRETWVRRVKQPFFRMAMPDFLFTKFSEGKAHISIGLEASRYCWEVIDSIAEMTGKKIIVDSSKNAEQFRYLLYWRPSSVKIIHLIRDGRGVVHSKMTRAGDTARKATKNWVLENLKLSVVKNFVPSNKRLTIKYEDLCQSPESEISKIFSFMGISNQDNLLSAKDRHNVCGSPHRFDWKNMEIRLDERWKTDFSKSDRNTFAVFGGWLNRIYGYK